MTVVAKFYVASKTEHATNAGSVKLNPVTRGAENAQWAAATPSGSMELFINNRPALDAFEVGKEYLITFEPYEAPKPEDGHAFERDPRPGHERDTCCARCGHVEVFDGKPTHAV